MVDEKQLVNGGKAIDERGDAAECLDLEMVFRRCVFAFGAFDGPVVDAIPKRQHGGRMLLAQFEFQNQIIDLHRNELAEILEEKIVEIFDAGRWIGLVVEFVHDVDEFRRPAVGASCADIRHLQFFTDVLWHIRKEMVGARRGRHPLRIRAGRTPVAGEMLVVRRVFWFDACQNQAGFDVVIVVDHHGTTLQRLLHEDVPKIRIGGVHPFEIADDGNRILHAGRDGAGEKIRKGVDDGAAGLVRSGQRQILRRVEIENTLETGRVRDISHLMFTASHDEIVFAIEIRNDFQRRVFRKTARLQVRFIQRQEENVQTALRKRRIQRQIGVID